MFEFLCCNNVWILNDKVRVCCWHILFDCIYILSKQTCIVKPGGSQVTRKSGLTQFHRRPLDSPRLEMWWWEVHCCLRMMAELLYKIFWVVVASHRVVEHIYMKRKNVNEGWMMNDMQTACHQGVSGSSRLTSIS